MSAFATFYWVDFVRDLFALLTRIAVALEQLVKYNAVRSERL